MPFTVLHPVWLICLRPSQSMPELGTRVPPREPCGSLQVSGVVFFSVETAEHLLATHVSPPLDACTYMGLDSGAQPVQVTKGSNPGPLTGSERLSDLGPVRSPFWVSLSADGTSSTVGLRGPAAALPIATLLTLTQLSLFFDILLCMARNMSRENFVAGRPPEMGQGDPDVARYLKGARAQLWRELRDQPLTMGGYLLLALG